MLNVGVTIKIIRRLFRTVALHNIVKEILYQFTICLRPVKVFQLHRTINLCSARGIRLCFCCEIIPVFGNLAVFIETENIKRCLFACTGKVINRLQENLVSVLKSTDIIYHGLYRSGCKISNRADKGVTSCAIGEIVLDVSFRKQTCCFFSITVRKSIDEFKSFLCICHYRFLLPVCLAVAKNFLNNIHHKFLL